ncbi:hypothetical protein BGZ80_004600 [Entomortierella chlamydospora]|uniref:Uncharacterized protein n=1 Tax=Entomortierella chlamydospora TaxID=101097 RepID=A0A9P6MMU0_9FUNG|nr:hypothetical protein BGZ80_004600 [Entomortierella chlamydospora]
MSSRRISCQTAAALSKIAKEELEDNHTNENGPSKLVGKVEMKLEDEVEIIRSRVAKRLTQNEAAKIDMVVDVTLQLLEEHGGLDMRVQPSSEDEHLHLPRNASYRLRRWSLGNEFQISSTRWKSSSRLFAMVK